MNPCTQPGSKFYSICPPYFCTCSIGIPWLAFRNGSEKRVVPAPWGKCLLDREVPGRITPTHSTWSGRGVPLGLTLAFYPQMWEFVSQTEWTLLSFSSFFCFVRVDFPECGMELSMCCLFSWVHGGALILHRPQKELYTLSAHVLTTPRKPTGERTTKSKPTSPLRGSSISDHHLPQGAPLP